MATALAGCSSPHKERDTWIRCGAVKLSQHDLDRMAILGMAGTYKVSFEFEEVLALREGYELHKPYETEAEELVVVVEDTGDMISLQHLLVVRHGGETHVINHWRQDWVFERRSAFGFAGENAWERITFDRDEREGAWVQSVYNVADSPRYASIGKWQHHRGVASWTGSPINRPLPLREKHLDEAYDTLVSTNSHVVTLNGWVHYQMNHKYDSANEGDPVLSLERGVNRYARVPDENFEKAHEYWENTEPYWKEVRAVWADALEGIDRLELAKRWKGDPLFSHLFGLADEYWGQAEVSGARPRIEEIIEAFVVSDKP